MNSGAIHVEGEGAGAAEIADAAGVDPVFKALADVTRRGILDALFERDGQSLTALGERFPSMTRFGVMKHLEVLTAANLVTTHKSGRQRLHYLNPVPIQQIADRWISKYAQPFTRALVDLQTIVEAG
jgi:DNA-binding transcriptional ArsR family regulator